MPRSPHPLASRKVVAPAVAVVLLLVAAMLVPALRDERRLQTANEELQSAPAAAFRDSTAAIGPATRARVTTVAVSALVGVGDLRGAERLARADVRAHPDNPYSARRLYQVQKLRGRDAAARRTLRTLRTLDPKFADGTGF